MIWRVRTSLVDRPGALAALAGQCGEHGVNILSLQIFPHPGGVTDELLLSAPDNWEAEHLEALTESSGGRSIAVSRCSETSLVDAPTAYLHAAWDLLASPSNLSGTLARLLGTQAGGGDDDADVLRLQLADTTAEVRREIPFTDVERARAAALARFTQWDSGGTENWSDRAEAGAATRPTQGSTVRPGSPLDVPAVQRMHERCSIETLSRRYHSPLGRVSVRIATQLLEPAGGASFVATDEDEVVGMAVLAPHGDGVVEVGVLVEDGWQRRGIGSNLVRAAAELARERACSALLLVTQPDNRAVIPMLHRSGFSCRARMVDGSVQITVPLAVPSAPPHPRGWVRRGGSGALHR